MLPTHGRLGMYVEIDRLVFHAPSNSDDEQRNAFEELQTHIPRDPTCQYVWVMDRNNVPDPTLDYKHATGAPLASPHPLHGIVCVMRLFVSKDTRVCILPFI